MRRSREEIIKDILELCQNIPHMITGIGLKCRISNGLANELLSDCLRRKQIVKTNVKDIAGRTQIAYLSTEAGKSYVKKFYALIGVLGGRLS